MSEREKFGIRMREAMRSRGITQQELASRMYVCQQCVYQYQSAINGPTVATLRRIREAIGCSWEELLDEE